MGSGGRNKKTTPLIPLLKQEGSKKNLIIINTPLLILGGVRGGIINLLY